MFHTHTVLPQTLKYNSRLRTGRGFSLEERNFVFTVPTMTFTSAAFAIPSPMPAHCRSSPYAGYSHDPYTLPPHNGCSWEETWQLSQMKPSTPKSPLHPSEFASLPHRSPLSSPKIASLPRHPSPTDHIVPIRILHRELAGSPGRPISSGSSGPSADQDIHHAPLPTGPVDEDPEACLTRFPLSLRGRCAHRDHWLRLRAKRGYTYFLCTHCMCGWRKPRDTCPPPPAPTFGN